MGSTEFIVVSGRDKKDQQDLFVCLDAETGVAYWEYAYESKGNLDYGNSPRAGALIADPFVYIQGAFGQLHCLDIETGQPVWSKHLVNDFQGVMPIWGYCSSPLNVDDLLIVQPGGQFHSMIALDKETGELKWSCAGRNTAYASPISFSQGGTETIVAFDDVSMGGWDSLTGKRLWEYVPKNKSDFNVPTPFRIEDKLIASSENNGTRVLDFGSFPSTTPKVVAEFSERTSDTHSPIRLGSYIAAVFEDLYILDPQDSLKVIASFEDKSFTDNTSLIAFEDRLMTISETGIVTLFQLKKQKIEKLGQWELTTATQKSLSYPAMIGRKLIYRSSDSVVAWEW